MGQGPILVDNPYLYASIHLQILFDEVTAMITQFLDCNFNPSKKSHCPAVHWAS